MNFKNIILSLLILFGCLGLNGQTFTHVNYQKDTSNFTNPGGFYHADSHIDYNNLLSYRKEGISLIFKTYQLGRFKNGLISTSFLRNMEEDFNILRRAGVKAVIRFSYTDKSTPPYGDARPEIVLRHIRQLKPVLMANSDVILVLQAGFIGAWGEWYYTDYYSVSPGNISKKNWTDRRQLVDSLLASIPANRMVQVRTPQYKIKLLNMQAYVPVKPSQAYTDLPIARIAHHNDCFVAGPGDMGTYVDSTVEKPYLAKDSKYTIVGGETCQKSAQSTGSNSLKELRRFHWTFLNQDYNQSVIAEWQDQGYFPEIQKKLGYRFRMLDANLPDQSRPGGELNLKLTLINDGWANPTNPRNFAVILKNKKDGKEYYLKYQNDIRLWPISDTIHLHIQAGLPANIESGNYEFYLNLSDGDTKLIDRPEYSIRMANTGIWDNKTGYNSLNHILNVDSTNNMDTYYGGNYFKEKNYIQSIPVKIIIDGNADDWSTVPVIYSATDQKAKILKIFNTKDSLFILIQGDSLYSHSQFLFDSDNDSATGAFYGPWMHTGFDYLIENGNLYQYDGTDHKWNWQYVSGVDLSQNDQVIELKVPFSLMKKSFDSDYFRIGFINNFDNDSNKNYLPLSTESLISVEKNNINQRPQVLVVKNFGTNNLVYWTRNLQSSNVYTVLQRSENDSAFSVVNIFNNNEITYNDKDLSENHHYQYRLQYKEGNKLSAFSDTIKRKTTSSNDIHFVNIKLDGQDGDWNVIPPSATGIVHDSIAKICFFNNSDSLYISINSVMKHTYSLYLDIGDLGGFDYLIKDDSLFVHSSGIWNFKKLIPSKHSKDFVETGLKMSDLSLNAVNILSASLFVDSVDVWGKGQVFRFMKYQTLPVPGYFKLNTLSEYTYSRVKISWYPNQSPDGYIIERSENDSLHFKRLVMLDNTKFQYIDKHLDSTKTYYYRMFAYKDILRSAYTSVQWMKPGITGINNLLDRSAIVQVNPNPVRLRANIHLSLRSPDKVIVSLISMSGRKVAVLYNGYINENKVIPFQKGFLKPGYYILKISGPKTYINKKIIIY